MWPRNSSSVRTIRRVGGAALLAAGVARRRMLRWGATDSELRRTLPGDELSPMANLVSTRAITIHARPADVWPWIVQIGQGRGGFYSYDRLENLAGCDIHSADSVVPEWQHLDVGDEVSLAPGMALRVARVEPDRVLVLRGDVPTGGPPMPFEFTWTFVISDPGDGTSRLLVRERYTYRKWWVRLMVEPTEIVSFVMTQRMLRGVRDRVARSTAWNRTTVDGRTPLVGAR
jgi:hypothetical protein